jgi:hypothetical protein
MVSFTFKVKETSGEARDRGCGPPTDIPEVGNGSSHTHEGSAHIPQ